MLSTLRELYLRCYPRVVQAALEILSDRQEAEDVAQDVFVAAWRRKTQYDATRGSEWAWLRTMTRSRALDRLRASRRRQQLAGDVTAPPPDEQRNGDTEDVRTLLARLSVRERTVLEFAFLNGLTHREIAERTREPLGTVKTRIRAALARLGRLVNESVAPAVSCVREEAAERS
jgi:RNA polymerase sigma-70 factor (ECF subfamily)